MRLLLDTHALLWWIFDSPQLSAKARAWIADEDNAVFVSAVSALEITTKERIGKRVGEIELGPRLLDLIAADGFELLAITPRHGITAGMNPAAHRDPFDRLLAAQALLEDLSLVSRDAAFVSLGITPIW